MSRVLIISSDILPYPGMPTVGSGLRAWGLGHGLKSRGHEVLFSIPRAALQKWREVAPPEAVALAWEHHSLVSVIEKANPEAVVVCNWPLMAAFPAGRVDMPVILDQHGPHYLEREYQQFGDPKHNARAKIEALQKADYFTCAGQKQWTYFQSWLEQAGWSEQERREQSGVIPVSLGPNLPERQPAGELTFVYGGVFLPWQDPTNGLFALIEMMEKHGRGRLYFYGGKHPVYPVHSGVFEQLLARLNQSPYVIAPGLVSHDELIDRYRRAHVAIDVMKYNRERELAFTTRTVEYLWCGLPVLYHDYAELSDYIRRYEAGWLVDPEDSGAIEAALSEIFERPDLVAERSQNAQRLAYTELNWEKTITPLDQFLRQPVRRTHRSASALPLPVQNMQYLIREAWFHYRRGGMSQLWKEGWTFLRRQITFK